VLDDSMRERIALFRYGLIAPLLNNQVDRNTYLADASSKIHAVPYYGDKRFAAKTIATWFLAYQKNGFDTLKPRGRSDNGRSRSLSEEQQSHLRSLRLKYPDMPATVFYDHLIRLGEILPSEVSYSTIYRFLRKYGLLEKSLKPEEGRRRFAHDTVNRLWQGDLSDGPYVPMDGKKVKTYLIAFIDDCSRLVPYAQFFPSERFDGLRIVLKEAMIRRGIPKMIYTDNGKIYRSDTLHFACASLGIILTHTQPYDPASKGKIERFFRTVKTRFFPLLHADPANSLAQLNERFWAWLEEDYHRKLHASLEGKTPLEVYVSQVEQIKLLDDPGQLDPVFLKRETRKVKHDATLSLNGKLFQVPDRFIGRRVELRYDEQGVHVYEEGKAVAAAELIHFSDNAHVKRDRPKLSFQSLVSGEERSDV